MILEWKILQSELAWPPQRVFRLVKGQAVIHQLAMLAEDQMDDGCDSSAVSAC